jgi:hypothetical protein
VSDEQRYRVTCWRCGGEGELDGEGCTCGEDTCCCLEPEPPSCDICNGAGSLIVTKLTEDNCADAVPIETLYVPPSQEKGR